MSRVKAQTTSTPRCSRHMMESGKKAPNQTKMLQCLRFSLSTSSHSYAAGGAFALLTL